MGYAAVGIPLMLIYLSSMGSLLSNCARHIFTRSLCCCLCSNCGYCCYDEKRMQEKERRMRKKREQKEYEQQMQTLRHHQEPFYVRSPSSTFTTSTSNNLHSPVRVESDGIKMAATRTCSTVLDSECLSADTSVVEAKDEGNCLAPLTLCFLTMITYICGGAIVLCRLDSSWTFLDSIFFCFMTLSTIGFGDSIPSASVLSTKIGPNRSGGSLIIWFCSLYILAGMALTAMCFNVVHDEIVHKLKHHYNETSLVNRMAKENSVSTKLGSTSNFLDSETGVNTSIDYPPTSWPFSLKQPTDTDDRSGLFHLNTSDNYPLFGLSLPTAFVDPPAPEPPPPPPLPQPDLTTLPEEDEERNMWLCKYCISQ